ncbi:hypothetical protein GWI33_000946 [Rhynchophorus ferrugineus]|uniref:Uncharacterized protein n=1 Tax=Rhynchophorus ferrugineus TaxID=354439 RepID=A0A834ISS7_RHYFE|nr:hypothetical protein GWI33_000946 [Rhynchophorus ferrugineus]
MQNATQRIKKERTDSKYKLAIKSLEIKVIDSQAFSHFETRFKSPVTPPPVNPTVPPFGNRQHGPTGTPLSLSLARRLHSPRLLTAI